MERKERTSRILINMEMNEFALGLQDGIIIATSDEMYDNYLENIQ